MRIEVLIDGEEPKIYPLNKPKLSIGSFEGCDIILNAEGISRKHLIVLSSDDQYYVMDNGSSNGTYINDQRIIPGQKIEFTSFFPVRLGSHVIISLLSDEDFLNDGREESSLNTYNEPKAEAQSAPQNDQTRLINLKDLKSTKTESLISRRKESTKNKTSPVKKTSPKDKDKFRMLKTYLAIGSLVAFSLVYKFYLSVDDTPPVVPQPIAKVGEVIEKKPDPKPTEDTSNIIAVVEKQELTPKDIFPTILKDIKCTTDAEAYLCSVIPSLNETDNGAFQRGTMLNIFFDGTDSFTKATEVVKVSTKSEAMPIEQFSIQFENQISYTAFLIYFETIIPDTFNYEIVKDLNLSFIMQVKKGDGTVKQYPSAIKPESLKKFRELMDEKHLQNSRDYGPQSLEFLRAYFIQY